MTLSQQKMITFLIYIALALIAIHSIILILYFTINDPEKFDFIRMFDLDMEQNIPTLFSSLLFFIASFLFYLISKQKIQTYYWLGLSIIFSFLAFDESAKIHEEIGDFTEQFIDASGFLYYPWFISYSIALCILALIYARFFLKIPRKQLFAFIISATLFLTGAIGFDILGAKEASMHGEDTIVYCLLYTIEESLEMFGLIYLISILMGLIKDVKITLQT